MSDFHLDLSFDILLKKMIDSEFLVDAIHLL